MSKCSNSGCEAVVLVTDQILMRATNNTKVHRDESRLTQFDVTFICQKNVCTLQCTVM